MPLPGKLCIGILEEDNPQKSYFRFKPILMDCDGAFQVYHAESEYPEDGCIRIVPDKNESNHFKIRMRDIGKFCAVDLREHPGENDKIRPNKNYKGDHVERNSHIIYSDVICAIAPNMIAEILNVEPGADAAQMALAIPTPSTPTVLLTSHGSPDPFPWRHSPIKELEGGLCLSREDTPLDLNTMQEFQFSFAQGEELRLMVARPDVIRVLPRESKELKELKFQKEAKETKESKDISVPVEQVQPVPPVEPQIAVPVEIVPKPEPVEEVPPKKESFEKKRPEKEVSDAAAQMDINSKRARASFSEIVEDKWRHSRLEQLGQPVPPEAMTQPALSPVEIAVNAIRDVWQQPSAHRAFMEALVDMEEFRSAMQQLQRTAEQAALEQSLIDLEARRLELLDEIRVLEQKLAHS